MCIPMLQNSSQNCNGYEKYVRESNLWRLYVFSTWEWEGLKILLFILYFLLWNLYDHVWIWLLRGCLFALNQLPVCIISISRLTDSQQRTICHPHMKCGREIFNRIWLSIHFLIMCCVVLRISMLVQSTSGIKYTFLCVFTGTSCTKKNGQMKTYCKPLVMHMLRTFSSLPLWPWILCEITY